MASTPKILIIGPSWVGDMVMAQSLFKAIKNQQADATIDVLAPAWSRPILERMPEVSQALVMPLGHGAFNIKARRQLGHQLREQAYSQSIVLPNSWKSALIPWFADIPQRTGWKGEARYGLLNDLRKLDKEQLPLMVQRFVALAYPNQTRVNQAIIEADKHFKPGLIANQKKIPELLEKFQLSIDEPILALCPGAEFGPSKQWPIEHYRALAQKMLQQGWNVWIMGSPADTKTGDAICAGDSNTAMSNLCGQTSLEEAIDLLPLATQVVSNDSGLMHIASALEKPLVAIYGSTSPGFTPPLAKTATVIASDIDCSPCFQRSCPLGHHQCMQELKPDQVIKALQ